MLLQFPLPIAFYTAVTLSLEIRQAFVFMDADLSAGDPFTLEFAFAISMRLSRNVRRPPVVTPEQQMQQKMSIDAVMMLGLCGARRPDCSLLVCVIA